MSRWPHGPDSPPSPPVNNVYIGYVQSSLTFTRQNVSMVKPWHPRHSPCSESDSLSKHNMYCFYQQECHMSLPLQKVQHLMPIIFKISSHLVGLPLSFMMMSDFEECAVTVGCIHSNVACSLSSYSLPHLLDFSLCWLIMKSMWYGISNGYSSEFVPPYFLFDEITCW